MKVECGDGSAARLGRASSRRKTYPVMIVLDIECPGAWLRFLIAYSVFSRCSVIVKFVVPYSYCRLEHDKCLH
jgi:hypothetical protein